MNSPEFGISEETGRRLLHTFFQTAMIALKGRPKNIKFEYDTERKTT